MKVFYFDWGREESRVRCLDIANGKDLGQKTVRGSLDDQIEVLAELIERNRPQKIIFDEVNSGIIFKDKFVNLVKQKGIYIDKNGSIQYEDELL
ncbi:hypothetical protein [Paraliobacillus ryukyuensis]|uniref:hypothetical protein n=1 Tax=Paraliobacillus ryukyuensis TaxID=200904 RepID=UPI0009A846E1|nr:hypothetical protein [Paraliobacillus ryukyuensis]